MSPHPSQRAKTASSGVEVWAVARWTTSAWTTSSVRFRRVVPVERDLRVRLEARRSLAGDDAPVRVGPHDPVRHRHVGLVAQGHAGLRPRRSDARRRGPRGAACGARAPGAPLAARCRLRARCGVRSSGVACCHHGHERRQLLGRQVAADHPQHRRDRCCGRLLGGVGRRRRLVAHQSGMFPCFLGGSVSRLVRSRRSALVTSARVCDGSITPSM